MEKLDKKEIRDLIIRITGPKLNGEFRGDWLRRAAGYVGIGNQSMRKLWYGEKIAPGVYVHYASRNTLERLKKAENHAQKPEYLIVAAKRQNGFWQSNSTLYQPFIDATCRWIGDMEQAARELEQAARELEQAQRTLERAGVSARDGDSAREMSGGAAGTASA